MRWGLALYVALALAGCGDEVRIARPPTAFAGFDRVVQVGDEVVLDASLSSDPDGDPLGFDWALVSRPDASEARLDTGATTLARFVADVPGVYVAHLSAADEDFVAQDLVSITATAVSTSSVSVGVEPAVCQTDLTDLGDCGGVPGRVTFTATSIGAESITWRFLRLPAGLSDDDLDVSSQDGALSFVPPRPGDYWVVARATSATGASIAVASVGVFDGDAHDRPLARLEAPRRAQRGNFVLFDGRASTVGTSTSVQRTWSLVGGPAEPSALDSFATGCPPEQCRRLIPMAAGTYIVAHRITADGRAGVHALAAVEVE